LGSVGTHDPVAPLDPEAPDAAPAPLDVNVPEVEATLPDAVTPEVGAVTLPLDRAPPEAPVAACEGPLAASALTLPGLPEPPASPFSAPFDEHANCAVTTAHKQMRFGIRASELSPSVNGFCMASMESRSLGDGLCVLPDSSADIDL
jgi:hypothetical protein